MRRKALSLVLNARLHEALDLENTSSVVYGVGSMFVAFLDGFELNYHTIIKGRRLGIASIEMIYSLTSMRSQRLLWVSVTLCIFLLGNGAAAPTPASAPTSTSMDNNSITGGIPSPSEAIAIKDSVTCVYPISGQYGFLPRLLYYCSLIFALIGRSHTWLVLGALTSAMSFAGSTAIHLFTLSKSKSPVYDLDILVAWAILTSAGLIFIVQAHWSSSLRKSSRESGSRYVLLLWGMLLAIACMVARGLIVDVETPSEPACRSATGRLLTQQSELESGLFNCTYQCFGNKTSLRQSSEITVMPTKIFDGFYAKIIRVLMLPLSLPIYRAFAVNYNFHSPSYQYALQVLEDFDLTLNVRLSKHIYSVSCSS
ncbi:hypothetical protein FQN49_008072, partial [Arthroderma sp. PD_2]